MLRPFPGKSLAKLQGNRGTVFVCCTGLDGISPVRRRFPLPAFFFTGLTGHQRYLIRYHKSGIKADAELSDQVLIHCIFRGAVLSSPISGGLFGLFRQLIRFGQPGQKFSGPGLGDSADIFDDFLFVHTYARICNCQGMFFRVRGQTDLKFFFAFQQFRIGQRRKTQFIHSIAGIGNQLPQKNLVIGIDGMNHQI